MEIPDFEGNRKDRRYGHEKEKDREGCLKASLQNPLSLVQLYGQGRIWVIYYGRKDQYTGSESGLCYG